MLPAMIEGMTRVLGKAQGFTGLPIRDDQLRVEEDDAVGIVSTMTTAWEPSPKDVAAIAAGAKIEITIMGSEHPPISVAVGSAPEG